MDKLREQFASVLRRGQTLPTEIVVEMLCGVLRDQEPAAWMEWAENSGAWFLAYSENCEATTRPLYATPIPSAAPPDKCAALLERFVDAMDSNSNTPVSAASLMLLRGIADKAREVLAESRSAPASVPDQAAIESIAHRTCTTYRHSERPEYTFLPHTLMDFVRQIAAALKPAGIVVSADHSVEFRDCHHQHAILQQTGDGTPVEFCPDCGRNEIVGSAPKPEGE